jgi:hypothetical protein
MTKEIKKPSIADVLTAYQIMPSIMGRQASAFREVCSKVFIDNRSYLEKVQYDDYNFDNFIELIDSMENHGESHFNMSHFIAKKSFDRFDSITGPSKNDSIFSNTTNAFNCNSIGCIAGFAAANALNWREPSPEIKESGFFNDMLIDVACNWLNIPHSVGKSIFFAESPCVWVYASFFIKDPVFSHFEWDDATKESFYEDYYDNNDLDPTFWDEYGIELDSIKYEAAISLLKMIVSREIVFPLQTPQQKKV